MNKSPLMIRRKVNISWTACKCTEISLVTVVAMELIITYILQICACVSVHTSLEFTVMDRWSKQSENLQACMGKIWCVLSVEWVFLTSKAVSPTTTPYFSATACVHVHPCIYNDPKEFSAITFFKKLNKRKFSWMNKWITYVCFVEWS